MKPPAICLAVVSIAALLLAGCGGGGSSAGSSATAPRPSTEGPGGRDAPVEKATAPKAPAGSKVVACATDGAAADDQGKAPGADGGAEVSGLRAAGIDCGAARTAMRRWQRSAACRLRDGASRASCSLGSYRCQAIDVDRGAAVSCARPDGGDVSFVAARRSSNG